MSVVTRCDNATWRSIEVYSHEIGTPSRVKLFHYAMYCSSISRENCRNQARLRTQTTCNRMQMLETVCLGLHKNSLRTTEVFTDTDRYLITRQQKPAARNSSRDGHYQ